jgi:hypothetical protein
LACHTISSDIDVFGENGFMRQASFHHALRVVALFVCSLCATSSLAQKVDAEFLRAISTIYAGGFTGQIVKEWCDERVPNLSDQNAKVLEAWRKKMELPMIEARITALVGAEGKDSVTASLEDKREAFYEQLDKGSTNPETDCAELGKALNDDFNLKVLYANEYKIVAANPVGTGAGSGGSSTGGNSSSGSGGSAGKDSGKTPVTTGPNTTNPSTTGPSTTASKSIPKKNPSPTSTIATPKFVAKNTPRTK